MPGKMTAAKLSLLVIEPVLGHCLAHGRRLLTNCHAWFDHQASCFQVASGLGVYFSTLLVRFGAFWRSRALLVPSPSGQQAADSQRETRLTRGTYNEGGIFVGGVVRSWDIRKARSA
jgi:hypothetical protein